MLAFARRQELKPVPVDIEALVHGMFDLLQRSLGPTVDIELRLSPGLPRVRVDPNQLELALLNLTVNARDAMAGGGTITIEATSTSHGRRRQVEGRWLCPPEGDRQRLRDG